MNRADEVSAILRASPRVMQVLQVMRDQALPDPILMSGAVYQTVWNHLTGRPADYGVRDYDVGYHDASDVSYEAEDGVIKAMAAAFEPPLRELVEVRNQARVHLWFEAHFGEPYAALASSSEALSRFVSPAFAVGVRLDEAGVIKVLAPFGLDDLFAMRLRPDPNRPLAKGWGKTTASAKARWPQIEIVEP